MTSSITIPLRYLQVSELMRLRIALMDEAVKEGRRERAGYGPPVDLQWAKDRNAVTEAIRDELLERQMPG